MSRRSTVTPLTIGIVLMLLVVALAVGWQVLVFTDTPREAAFTALEWSLLILGSIFFVLLMVGLVWMSVVLVREMRLNQSQRAFLDAVTHEMKTPLASFRLYLDTLGRHDPSPDRRREFLKRMREDLDRLDATVEQVLAAARAEEGRRPRPQKPVDVAPLLVERIEAVREHHALPPDAIRLVVSDEGALVRGDPGELELVFGNLLENAVKYSQAPVDVRVEVGPARDGRVQVEIADRGIGIPRGELRKIFQRFHRVGRDVQRQVAGLGLGLFVARSLVRRHGGRIVARSEGHGRGSRFVVTLRSA